MNREDGMRLAKRHDGKIPWTYLGRRLEDILAEIDMTVDEFVDVCDRFTNKRLFVCDNRGKPIKDADGNLIRVNDDNE